MLDLEWWQWLVGAVALLGLSPAPWLAALLSGRLITRSTHEGRVTDLKEEIARIERRHDGTVARIVAEKDLEREARGVERDRADVLADKLSKATDELGATALHLLESIPGLGGDNDQG